MFKNAKTYIFMILMNFYTKMGSNGFKRVIIGLLGLT